MRYFIKGVAPIADDIRFVSLQYYQNVFSTRTAY